MKTFLNVPYDQKDQAKRLGAQWDATRKSWYIYNTEDMNSFMKWMPKKHLNLKKKQTAVVTTGPSVVTKCNCSIPPWEDCEHTDLLAVKAMKEILG